MCKVSQDPLIIRRKKIINQKFYKKTLIIIRRNLHIKILELYRNSSTKVVASWTSMHSKHKQASEIYTRIKQMINSSMSSLSNLPSALDSNFLSIPFQTCQHSEITLARFSCFLSFPALLLYLMDQWILYSGKKLR